MTNRKFVTQILSLKIKIGDSDFLLLKKLLFRFENIWTLLNKLISSG